MITNDDYVVVEDGNQYHYVEITLKDSPGGNNYYLSYSYDASKMADQGSNYSWTFDNGKSAGVCVVDGLFYEADTSDLRKPFSDGFVTFHISDYGIEGSGMTPYFNKTILTVEN